MQADALSRRPHYEVKGNQASPAILAHGKDGVLHYRRPTLAATLALQPEPLIARIRQETANDPIYGIAEKETNRLEKMDDGTIQLHGLIYVPEKLRSEVIASQNITIIPQEDKFNFPKLLYP